MSDLFLLSRAQMSKIEPFFPKSHGVALGDDRRVPSGIAHALRRGGRRAECGIREGIFSAPAGAEDTPDRLFIDSSCIRVHRCASGGKGRP